MHQVQANFDLTVEELTKIEGAAALDIKVRQGKVEEVKLKITEYKRFYTQAVRGKEVMGVPQLLARICGTCSNAHLICSVESIEKGLGITPSEQTQIMRRLAINGLMIRDHGLHLYVFALPDLLGKDSILELDEENPAEHELLHDTFTVKAAGNQLSINFGGRSVHAPFIAVGGFSQFPDSEIIEKNKTMLHEARPAALRLIKVFADSRFSFKDDTTWVALKGKDYNFIEGNIVTSAGHIITEGSYRDYLEHQVIPYSQASGYSFQGRTYMVGALARMNLSRELLHPRTRENADLVLNRFPSNDVFDNNLAQAVEILHAIDDSLELLEKHPAFPKEPLATSQERDGDGVGVIEAPRGTLYHRLEIRNRKVAHADIIVPTGQNQVSMEKNVKTLVENNLELEKDKLTFEIEKLIRAYDPCMSCATHFLKIKWL